MSHPVKIAIIEPSIIIRSGILSVLHRLNTIQMNVFEITEAEQLKSSLSWQKPDILIINPSVLSLFSLQQIKKEVANPQLKYIALQNSLSDSATLKAYDEVISIYDSAEQINEKLTRLIIEPEEEKRHESLTIREKEIIVCVIKGMTNKQIADKLHLSSHTVISHRRNIATKLQIHSTAGLTIYAIVNKLVELDDIKGVPDAADS
ncbi:MAG: LuxR C-terminal-related transcriptional regulator [Candidatus Symbiothrix sp.]|jgi:DNA-binding NarL/FixJ family response regulator|nr:LuxR C-terminal-related transcriptional regulator [Candidatus Symbiothrix sp.]